MRSFPSALSQSVFMVALLAPACLSGQSHSSSKPSNAATAYGNLPLSFEANQGQTDPSVKALAHGQGYTLFLRSNEAVLELHPPESRSNAPAPAVRLKLAGANPAATVSQEDPQITRTNYFIGRDPSQWRTDIPNFSRIRYSSVYPGIDLVYYGNQRQLEHDFILAPNADPSAVQLTVEGAQEPHIDKSTGELILDTAAGRLRLLKPFSYQQQDGVRRQIPSHYKLLAGNRIGFSIGHYDRSRPLVIDPILLYSTYLGGSNRTSSGFYYGDQGNAIAVDTLGDAYVTGSTYSPDFPSTAGAYQIKNKSQLADNVFISKLNPTGTALLFSTYLGGSGQASDSAEGDAGQAIALDTSGNIYVGGSTWSPDFPVTPDAFQTSNINYRSDSSYFSSQTGFVTKLNPEGAALLYSTYLGGTGTDVFQELTVVHAIAVDASGNAYVTGGTTSATFPVTSGTLEPFAPGGTFVTKLNTDGTALVYSTVLGTRGGGVVNEGNAIAVNISGNAYIVGTTNAPNFPITSNAFQSVNVGTAAFFTVLNPAGSSPIYSTFFGGSNPPGACDYPPGTYQGCGDSGTALAVDNAGHAYIGGTTRSRTFPQLNGLGYHVSNSYSGFVAKFNNASLAYSTLFGDNSSVSALAVDNEGAVYVTGATEMGYFPQSTDALQPNQSLNESALFIAKLNPSASAVQFSSLFGGTSVDSAQAIAIDPMGNAYVTGSSNSSDFQVTTGALQATNKTPTPGKGSNAFVTAFALSDETTDQYATIAETAASSKVITQGSPITITGQVFSFYGPTAPTGNVTLNLSPSIAPVVALKNVNGIGTATWTTSTLPAGLYTVTVTYPGDSSHLPIVSTLAPATFLVVGPPAQLQNLTGISYNYIYGQYTNLPISVEVLDAEGNPLQGITIQFSGTGFTFSSASAVSGATGVATTSFTATQAGSLSLTATVSGQPVTLHIPVNVKPASLTIEPYNYNRFYGSPNHALGYAINGLKLGDTVTVTPSTTATIHSPVGSYPITTTVTGSATSNYIITIDNATLLVEKAPLYISAHSVNVTYGQNPPPISDYALSGFVNGDTASVVSGAPVLNTTVTATTPVGVYAIGVQTGTLTAQNYYFNDFSNGEGGIYVKRAILTINPASYTIHVSDQLPAFTYTISGFVNGQTQATATTGAPVLYTTAPNPPTKGRYYIIAALGTLQAQNYSFQESVSNYGILTVLP